MARPESRFCIDIVILLLDKMVFEHAKQSELNLYMNTPYLINQITSSNQSSVSAALVFLDG